MMRMAPLLRPLWPLAVRVFAKITDQRDLPDQLTPALAAEHRVRPDGCGTPLPEGTVILVRDWFTALFDPEIHTDALRALRAPGYQGRHQDMSRTLFKLSWCKAAQTTTALAASGYSCRCQIRRLTDRTARSPPGLIADALCTNGATR